MIKFRNSRLVDGVIARWKHEPPLENRLGVPDQYSVFLHFWRIVATASVFLGHATRPDILFDTDFSLVGRATIPTFLMISGYFTIMSFSTGGRFLKKVLKRYWMLWVFFIPAAILVLLMDVYMIAIDAPITTKDKFDPDLSLARILAEAFYLITFSGEYWKPSPVGQGVFSNEAMWTIDYIMGYSLQTATLYLSTGWQRIAAICIVLLIIGPTTLLLAPLWFAGVLAFELHRGFEYRPDSGETRLAFGAAGIWRASLGETRFIMLSGIGVVVAIVSWISLELSGWGPMLYDWSKTWFPYDLRQHLGMAKRYPWQWSYVPSLFLLLLFSRFILAGPASRNVTTWFRTVSNYSLPVYAIHFSLMYFIQTFIPDYTPRHTVPDPYIMMVTTLILSIGYGYICFTWIKPMTDRWAARVFG